ncbi:MAG TPA: DUF1573 domain-containing protein [Ohtaekwangia sp.]|nr:DUF1573 domain-containing protein [Ohtaekwangia sp.]
MLRALFFAVICCAGFTVSAQQLKVLQFREEAFDFGSVAEEGGPVLHEFVFTNHSERPVKILNVQPSCGCTTPSWSKEPVGAGKTGHIQASYNPKGRPGYFNKTLTITTDAETTPIVLQIKGQVMPGGAEMPTEFQTAKGNWKLKTGAFNMGKVYRRDEVTTRDFQIINGSAEAINYLGATAPAYIKVDVMPKTLAPGAKGNIRISYHGRMKDAYGFQSDNIEIQTDDALSPVKSFSVYATLEDYFTSLSAEEMSKSPRLKLDITNVDFGKVSNGTTAVREVPFTNSGKKELTINSLQGNCTCIKAVAAKRSLKPGESATISVTFSPQDRSGTQTKAVTVYSNDPQNPVSRITITGYVD